MIQTQLLQDLRLPTSTLHAPTLDRLPNQETAPDPSTLSELAALAAQTPPLPARVHRLEGGHEFSLVERAIPLVLADAAECFYKNAAILLRSTP